MKNIYKCIFLTLFLSLLFPIRIYATHIVGGALTYVYNGSNSYTVTLTLYRDCTGFPYPPNVTIQVQQANGSEFAPSRDIINIPGGAITNVPYSLDTCAVPPNPIPCVQMRKYSATVTLPPVSGGYHLYYQLCCRNLSLSNINTSAQNNPGDGESFYAFIPGTSIWYEDFTLPNGTTVDAGVTAWTRTLGITPPGYARVETNLFEFQGAFNGQSTWSSQLINISGAPGGANVSVDLSEQGNLDANDSIFVYYSLNGGPLTLFPTNGVIVNDFGAAVATKNGLIGNTLKIFVRVHYDLFSPASELYRFDNVLVYNSVSNTTPVYNSFPPLFLCAGKFFTLDHSATDADGDSLVYSFYTPYRDLTPTFPGNVATFTPFTYNAGYTASSPLNAGGPSLTLNSSTGLLSGTPNSIGQFQVGIKTSEYRKGVLIGAMVRDFQFNIINCPPPAQALIIPSGTLTICSGNTLTFPNNSDPAATNWTWNFGNLSTTNDTSTLKYPTYMYPGPGAYTATLITNIGTSCADTSTAIVTVTVPPAAPTAGSNSPICAGSTLNLTASVVAGVTYSWTGPNGFSSTLQNPTIANATLAAAGTYSVTAIKNGCSGSSGTTTVVIKPIPAAPTAGSNSAICAGSTLNLTASAIAGAAYSWTGPNSFSSALQNPTIAGATIAASGTYSVTVTVNGCTGPAGTTVVVINPAPVAPTAGSNSPVCVGSAINLTASAVAGATYSWSGPNGFSSSSQNTSIANATLAAAGTYSVTATKNGCSGPAGTTIVVVNPIPPAPTAGSNSPICAGSNLNLTATVIAGATYSWSGPNGFSSSLQNPSIVGATTAASGTYSVTATVAGCTSVAGTTSVTVNPIPSTPAANSNSPVCSGTSLNLTTSAVAGATYSWTGPNSFSSALQNPSIANVTLAAAGTYSLTVTVNGCVSAAGTTSVTIKPTPAAPTAGSNSPVCVGSPINLTSGVIAGATYSWTGPNSFSSALQNPTIASAAIASAGTYSVSATVAGCASTKGTTAVMVNPIPAAPTAGSNSAICAGNNLNLTSSVIAGATYSWTGPNSFSSALQNPTIAGATIAASGTYSVTATVNGCTGPAGTTVVIVNPTPAAPIAGSNSPVCVGATLNLTASAIAGATYSWTGPNSFSSTLQNPSIANVTLAAAGTYSVTATVSGCPGPTGTTAVIVNPIPSVPTAGSNGPICAGSNLNLTATVIAGAIYSWTGPNSFSSSLQNPTIAGAITTASGTYSVTATVNGCTSPSGTIAVVVKPIPSTPAPGSNSPVCTGTSLNLITAAVAGATYSWTGPNSFSSALQNPSIANVTLAAAGTYSLTVTVSGCGSATGTTSVTIKPTPVAPTAGSNSPVCVGSPINLTSNVIAGATYSWTGPNSFSSALQNPTIASAALASAGTYSVSATVAGCTSTKGTTAVMVNPIPAAPTAGSNSAICAGNNLNLTSSVIAGATYSWTGPNSFSSSLPNPTIAGATIAASGTYSVTATVAGCTSAAGTTNVIVNPIPTAPTVNSNSPVCTGTSLNLTTAAVAGATYSWTGPNGFSSALQNPAIASTTLAAAGTYSLTITVSGCGSVSGTTSVVVNSTPAAPTAGSNSAICDGNTLNLTASAIGGATYSWTGPNGFSSSLQNPTLAAATTAASGTYSVTATVNGCTGSTGTTSVIVNSIPITPTANSNSPVCTGTSLNLTTSAVAGATYSWTGPNSFSSALQNPSIANVTLAAAGTYSLTVTISGCASGTGTTSVIVNPTPAAPTAGSNSPICVGSPINLTSSVIAGATYSWTGPNSFSSTSQNPTIASATAATSGTYSVTATVTGCIGARGTTTVVVNSIPITPTPGSNSPICVGSTLNLSTSAVAGATYSWTGPNSFSSALQNPSIAGATIAASGTYSLTVTVNGCTGAAGTISVTVNSAPVSPTVNSNTPVCSGDSLLLTASTIAGAIYSWTGPNSFSSSLQNPIIINTTLAAAGTYTVVVNNGCASSPATTVVTINSTPAPPTAGSNSAICEGSTLNLTASAIGGATYSWTGPNGFSSALQNPTIAGATATASGTYSVTATVNGCTSIARTTNVIVNSIPVTPIVNSNSPVCTGTSLNLSTAAVMGATYSWTGPNGFSSALQNPSIANVTLAAAGTYSLTVTVSGCSSATDTISVIIHSTPALPSAGSNSPICAGNNLDLSASVIAGATYSWTGPNSFSSALQNPSITNATTASSGTYSVTATVNGCTSVAGTVSAIVNSIPVMPALGSNSPICVGSTLNLSTSAVAGATYSWTGPNSFSSALQNPSIAGATIAASGIYSLTITVNGCTGAAGTISVTVNSAPVSPTVNSNTPVCSGDSLLLTASTIAGATYLWTGPNSFSSSLQNPFIVNTTLAAAGTYTVVVNNGCASSPATTIVTINSTPAAPTAGSNSAICDGSNLNLTASAIAGAAYSWTGPNSFSSALQNPTLTAATIAASGTYSVTATVNGCTGSAGSTNVIVNSIPLTPTVNSNSPVCTGTSLNLSTAAVMGATYSWTGPNGFSSALQNPSIANVTLAAAGTYSLTVTVSGCGSAADTAFVTIKLTPFSPTAGNNTPICEGSDLDLSASVIGGATYSWTGPNSFSSSLQNPSITGATITASGTYSVTATLNGCTSATAVTNAIVHPIPAAPAPGSNSPVCVGDTLNFSTPTVVGATYSWTGPNSFSSSLQNPSISGATTSATGTYSLTITVNGCTSIAGTTSATVNTAPVSPTAGSNTPVCSGDSLLLSASTIAGATYSWTGPNFFSSSLQNPFIINTTMAVAGTYTVVVNNGCASSPATTLVTINPTPAVPIAGSNSAICAGTDLNLTASAIAGAAYSWTGPNSFSSVLQNPVITGTTTASAGTYSVTSTVNGCTSSAGTIAVVVDQPSASIAGGDQNVCANNALVTISGNVTGGSSTGIWSTNGTGTFTPSNTSIAAAYNPTNADTAAGSVILTLTSTNNGACASSVSSMVVTITDAPIANAGNDQSVCANNANVNLNGQVTTATGGIWSSSGTGTFSPNNTTLNAVYISSAADTANGTITLTLTSTGNGTCLAVSDSMIVTITDAPSANAGADQFACSSSPNSNLSGTITGGAGTGIWTTSGNGTFSPDNISLNATYIPGSADTAAGSVIIILTTTNNGGCIAISDSMTIAYTTVPAVAAGTDQTVCGNNASVSLNGTIVGTSNTGIWSTNGSGTFSPSATVLNATYIPSTADTTSGSVTLTLSSTNSCSVISDALVITITDAPEVSAGADVYVCSNNANANLSAVISGATTTGTWTTTGSGSISPSAASLNIAYSPSAADIANGSVDLIITSTGNGNCIPVSDTVKIIFTPPPVAFAGNDTSMCANSSMPLSGLITGGAGTGIWTTSGSGTFSPTSTSLNAIYIPSNADTLNGTVTLTLTSTNNGGCVAVNDNIIITITDAPIAYAGIDQNVCSNNAAVALNGSVTVASGGLWTTSGTGAFDDAANFNSHYSPSIADIANGSITLILTTTGNGNCIPASDSMIVNFSPSPVMNANADQFICTGTVTANLDGSVSGATITGQWTTLGSGTFSLDTDMNAVYTLSNADATAGFVYLVLTSTNNGNCIAVSDTMKITITTIPVSNAGLDQIICSNNSDVALSGIINGGSGMGQWSTFNGTGIFTPSDTTLNAVYNSSAADTAQGFVSLVLTPVNSCLNKPDTMQITFTTSPYIFAGNDQSICNGGNINLTAGINNVPSGMIWTTNGSGAFTPNNSSLSVSYLPSAADAALDTIYFYATTTGNGNCFAVTDTVIVLFGNTPVADFISSGNCSGQLVSFIDSSAISAGTISGWNWNFGDGNISLLQNPTNIYTTAGTYTVSLVSSTSGGCSDTVVKTITISPPPAAAFIYTSHCSADSINFMDNSTISSGSISQWNWNFGDQTSSPLANPVHTYNVIDTFLVTLNVTSNSGCTSAVTQNIIVAPRPIADFGYTINCATGKVVFTDSSIMNGGDTINFYNWNFGNGDTSMLQNPLPEVYTPGSYIAMLEVTTQAGCTAVDTASIILPSPPLADFSPRSGQYLIGQTINFTNQSQNATSGCWHFGPGNDSSFVRDQGYTYNETGSYVVTLIASNGMGCYDTTAYQFDITMNPIVVPSAFSPNGDGLNDMFGVRGGPFNTYELRVFNDWGEQIFFTNTQEYGWDGTFKNKEQPAGSYVYTFIGITYRSEDIKLQGEIVITR